MIHPFPLLATHEKPFFNEGRSMSGASEIVLANEVYCLEELCEEDISHRTRGLYSEVVK